MPPLEAVIPDKCTRFFFFLFLFLVRFNETAQRSEERNVIKESNLRPDYTFYQEGTSAL